MAMRPVAADLDRLTDPAEREYVTAKRGSIPDDQLLDDLQQYRVIRAADRDEGRAPVAPTDRLEPDIEGPPDPLPTDSSGPPTFEQFYRDVAPLNPGYGRAEIEQIYNSHFGEQPEVLPSFEEFHAETKPLNPGASDEQIRAIWQEQFGSKGALEKNPGVLGTLIEGAKSTGRSALAFGQTLLGDTAGVEATAEDAKSAVRDPRLTKLLTTIAKRKEELGPDASWYDTGSALGKELLNDPKAAALLLAEQIPNTGAAIASIGAGAAIGSLAGPAGTLAGGIAGLFLANIGLETGAKTLERAGDGLTPMDRATSLLEGAEKGGIISAVDLATFGGTRWLTSTGARAMEAATLRTLEKEGVDVSSRAAIEEAAKDPAMIDRVHTAQGNALQAVNTLGQRTGRGAAEITLESVGEGVGEYVGELAATGQGDKMEAFIEAFAGLGQSTAEVGLASVISRYDKQAAIFGPTPDTGAQPIAKITEAPTVDDAIKKAGEAIGDAPPIDNEAIDRFIQGEKTGYSDAQHKLDQQAYQDALAGMPQAKRTADGTYTMHGRPLSSRVFRPDELPDEVPDGHTVTKSVYEALSTVLQAQGRRLVVVEAGNGYDGVVRSSVHPNTVFVSHQTTVDPIIVAFHESAHLMEGTPLYKAFQQVLFSELRQGAKRTALERHGRRSASGNLLRGHNQLSDVKLINEISADILGDAMTDPLFMEKVFTRLREQVGEAKATTEAQSFLDRLKGMITKVRDLITGKTFTTRHGERIALKYVKNLERVHDALATAVADLYYNQGKAQTSTVENTDSDYTEDSRRQGEERLILPPDVATAFETIGKTQRGAAEDAMIRVQEATGGGVLNPVVEHAGDLLHRMTHMAGHGTALSPYVKEKVDRVLKFLTQPYGFAKEHLENLAANSEYYKDSPKEREQKVAEALSRYAMEHAKLPVYNRPQWLAKHAAIAIGRQRWQLATQYLKELKSLVDADGFTTQAFAYTKTKDRQLVPYERPIKVHLIGVTPSGGMRIQTDLEARQFHIAEDRDGFRTGTKISGKELKERGYRPDVVDAISHEEDQTARKEIAKPKEEVKPKVAEKSKETAKPNADTREAAMIEAVLKQDAARTPKPVAAPQPVPPVSAIPPVEAPFNARDAAAIVSTDPEQNTPNAAALVDAMGLDEPEFSPAPIFVSSVITTLEAKLPNKGTGQQILALLKNTPGIKEEEIKWMGLDDFLKSKETFTKQEVIDFARANQIQLNEINKSVEGRTAAIDALYAEWKPKISAAFDAWKPLEIALKAQTGPPATPVRDQIFARIATDPRLRKEAEEWFRNYDSYEDEHFDVGLKNELYYIANRQPERMLINEQEFERIIGEPLVTPKERAALEAEYRRNKAASEERYRGADFQALQSREREAKSAYDRVIREWEDARDRVKDQMAPKFNRDHLVLPGGANYRELLLTLPDETKNVEIIRRVDLDEPGYAPAYEIKTSTGASEIIYSDPDNLDRLVRKTSGKMQGQFTSSHWDEPNVLAHTRFNDRVVDGKKMLFLEEIQSDFGQKTRRTRDKIIESVKNDFQGIVERMKKAGVLTVECD